MSFSARYPGRCHGCGERIHIGDEIDYDGLSTWVRHTDCAEAPSTAPDAGRTCTNCWLTIAVNGACGCD